MPARNWKLNFSTNNYTSSPVVNLASNVMNVSKPINQTQNANSLNGPMIGRVYKAKPGCSACGKKVA